MVLYIHKYKLAMCVYIYIYIYIHTYTNIFTGCIHIIYIYIYIYIHTHIYKYSHWFYIYINTHTGACILHFPSILTDFPVSFASLNLGPIWPPVTWFLNNRIAKTMTAYISALQVFVTHKVSPSLHFCSSNYNNSRFQWQRDLRSGSATAHLLGL